MAALGDCDLSHKFKNACNFVKSIAGDLDNASLLKIYSLYKQATEGPCNTPRPGFFDYKGKQKWDAWNGLQKMTNEDAMEKYVSFITEINPQWEEKMASGEVKSTSGLGVSVSTMARLEEDIGDAEKTVFDWCQDGDIEKVQSFLQSGRGVNSLDSQGMALLHWACDRGHADMVKMLCNIGADVNVADVDGQTPLHYACSCEHKDIVKLLLDAGCSLSIKDSEGLIPIECSENQEIIAMLQKN